MAKTQKLSDQEQVSQHIQKLDISIRPVIAHLRKFILGVDPLIGERIKWNNPSFYYTGELKESDPKDYKRELIVFNLFKNRIMLVLPGGAKVNDKTGLLEGNFPDGRRTILFKDMEDVKAKEPALKKIIQTWLELVDQ
jgi:hypothetical protein